MPKMNAQSVIVKSRGFTIWKQYEATHGRIGMEKIAEETGLGKSTVQKFIAKPDTEVNQAALLGAVVLARYFGAKLDELIYDEGGSEE